MRIDLHEIINVPGNSVSFDYEPDFSGLYPPAVLEELEKVRAKGVIRNTAGVLKLSAELKAKLKCSCDRCAVEFESDLLMPITAVLAEEQNDEENSDLYLLDGDKADLGEIINTAYVLDMDTKFLCKEDCKGLCPKCGKNLNEGPCDCRADTNPKLAVLKQLLMDK
jgi:uncharacterized protein